MAAQCGLGGTKWLDQFAAGILIAGVLSQKGVFAPNRSDETGLEPSHLFFTAEARFRDRSAKSGMKNAASLWVDALEQANKGWLCPPAELAASGQPTGFPRPGYNIAFRFGVEQTAKMRACGDLKDSLTNAARTILTPIQLVSWDHLSQLCRRFCDSSREWALLKADRDASYKQLPLAHADQARAVISLRHPSRENGTAAHHPR